MFLGNTIIKVMNTNRKAVLGCVGVLSPPWDELKSARVNSSLQHPNNCAARAAAAGSWN